MKYLPICKRLFSILLVTLFLTFELHMTMPQKALAGAMINCPGINNKCSQVSVEVGLPEATGFISGVVGDLAAIYGMGGVVGFSGAGITSGLAAIGSVVGGGMLAGVVITAAAPVATALAIGTIVHFASQSNTPMLEYRQ
jgi:predicted lipid-binding transport protein (Tim44 family)